MWRLQELLLEPDANPAAREDQTAIYAAGIPTTSFFVDDIEKEHKRLIELGVSFKIKPTQPGAITKRSPMYARGFRAPDRVCLQLKTRKLQCFRKS